MKKKITILICVLSGITFITIGSFVLIDWLKFNWSLNLSDWLATICSILSLVGTISLAVVAVMQTDKANKQNEALMEQNEKLQKINDKQFKITNQQFYPLLEIEQASFAPGQVENLFFLEHWKIGSINIMDPISTGSFFMVDAREDTSVEPKINSAVNFILKNISEAVIKEIVIYKIVVEKPFNKVADLKWKLETFTFTKGKIQPIKISFYHNNEAYIYKKANFEFYLYLRILTISNVLFYEKLSISASVNASYGKIEMISEEEITD